MNYEGLSPEHAYLFDTFGYIVLPDVLNLDQIANLRNTLKQPVEQWDPVDRKDSPLHWAPIWRELLDLPTLAPVLEDIIGNHAIRNGRRKATVDELPTYRLDHINIHTHVAKGFTGGQLHGGWQSTGGVQFSTYHNGQFFNGLISVSFELYDTHPNDGGFACIPGSHKSNVPLPSSWRDLSKAIADCVKRVPAKPGDAIVFTEAMTHGTLPWTSEEPRATVFYKFSPHGSAWSADYFDPNEFRGYPDMGDRKLTVLEAPNARYRGRRTQPKPRDKTTNLS